MLALGPAWTGVVSPMPELAHVLDHHADAMRVALRKMATGEVRGQLMVKLQTSAFDKLTCLSLATKAVGLELNQRREGKGVVAGDEVHILLTDAGHAKESLATIVSG